MEKGQFPQRDLSITEGTVEGWEFNPLAAPHTLCPEITAQILCKTLPASPGAAGGDFAGFLWFWEKNSTERIPGNAAGSWQGGILPGKELGGESPPGPVVPSTGAGQTCSIIGARCRQKSPVLLLHFPPTFPGNHTSGSLHQGEIRKSSS